MCAIGCQIVPELCGVHRKDINTRSTFIFSLSIIVDNELSRGGTATEEIQTQFGGKKTQFYDIFW